MTREEAITYLNVIWNRYKAEYEIERETLDAYHMAIEALSADAEPKMTEEVREALMRLTMCAREECAMCKYKDKCGFEFQYNISTENMNTLLDALSADVVPQSEQYKKGFEDCKRAYEIELARSADRELANLKEEFESAEYEDYEHATLVDIKEPLKVSVVRCKDCRWQHTSRKSGRQICAHHNGLVYADDDNFCSYGERSEPSK